MTFSQYQQLYFKVISTVFQHSFQHLFKFGLDLLKDDKCFSGISTIFNPPCSLMGLLPLRVLYWAYSSGSLALWKRPQLPGGVSSLIPASPSSSRTRGGLVPLRLANRGTSWRLHWRNHWRNRSLCNLMQPDDSATWCSLRTFKMPTTLAFAAAALPSANWELLRST